MQLGINPIDWAVGASVRGAKLGRRHQGAMARMRRGGIRLGGWLALPEPLIAEAAGLAGFDWVGLDLQHGAWDLGSAIRGIQILDLLNIPVLVRVAEDEQQLIPHVLDQGASGIVLAMTSGPETVASAIARARYQPEGLRSYGGQRYGLRAEAADVSTIRPSIYAMVEGRQGLDRIAEIAAVPGLAGVHVGPVDLGLGLGASGSAPAFAAALRTILDAGHAAGLPVTMHAVTAGQVTQMIELGFDDLVLTSDIGLLRAAFDEEIENARRMIAGAGTSTT
jgi:4-hydroxy-2-oxoheptanedioate aldolase